MFSATTVASLCLLSVIGTIVSVWASPMQHSRWKRTLYGVACPQGCSTCSAVNGCIKCKAPLFLWLQRTGTAKDGYIRPGQIGVCRSFCPDGYYPQRAGKSFSYCAKCRIENCESCKHKNVCTKCTHPFVVRKGTCVSFCPTPNALDANTTDRDCISLPVALPPPPNKPDNSGVPGTCQVGEWSEWEPCRPKSANRRSGGTGKNRKRQKKKRKMCRGLQIRHREVLLLPADSKDAHCPTTNDTRACWLRRKACADIANEVLDTVPEGSEDCLGAPKQDLPSAAAAAGSASNKNRERKQKNGLRDSNTKPQRPRKGRRERRRRRRKKGFLGRRCSRRHRKNSAKIGGRRAHQQRHWRKLLN